MATSSEFDLSSDCPNRPFYTNGQRGSHLAAQLDRSGSFRESMENPILSSLPNMTRSSSIVAQGDVVNLFQCLHFDPKNVAAEHRSSRLGDFKRHIIVAFGISLDSPSGSSENKLTQSPSPEEIKRVKKSLHESYVKARGRVKIFNEALSVFNKFFPSIPSKKRSRSEGFANDRLSPLLSSDRSMVGPSHGKMGIQNHAVSSGFEFESQKQEERTKNVVPNKRTRTSLVNVTSNALVRPSGTIVRDREMLKLANSGSSQGDDQTLSIGADGWEKTKLKKKRSAMKPDVSPSLASTKPTDGYREPKQGLQQRPVIDARSRFNSDSHGFRPGVGNGTVGVGKSDGILQSTGLNMRTSISRTDPDNSSFTKNDRRERPIGCDKEKAILRTVNKANVRDDFCSASPTLNTKMNASIRAPRSGSGITPKLSPVTQKATASNDWERSSCTNKPPTVGPNNRKRTASNRSSSPPVAHWAAQRPQKISRTARRTNLKPIVSTNDESPSLDTVSDASGNENGKGFSRRLTGNSPPPVKLKGDPISSATLSESEESGAPEIKSKEKGKKSDEIDEKVAKSVQKISSLGMPSRKYKLVTREDLGDGIRRQGRTGRGSTSTRSLMPMTVEKLDNVGTAKQLRSAQHNFDKNESKVGRPPTRKLSDRKAYVRHKHTMVNVAADFLDDGHEELLAAASAVINTDHACSSSFWRQMEPFFCFISDTDISYLKQQRNFDWTAPPPSRIPPYVNNCSIVPNGYGLAEHEDTKLGSSEQIQEQLTTGPEDISLYQRLIAAIISDEDCTLGNEELLEAYGTGFGMDGVLGSNGLNYLDDYQYSRDTAFNVYKVIEKPEHDEAEIAMLGISNMDIYSNFSHSVNVFSDQALTPGMECSEFQYDKMKLNEKLHLEVQSLGIFLDSMLDLQMENEAMIREIGKLEDKYHEQVAKKKRLLDKLLKSASETKRLQEKEFEQRALDKLITVAYQKYMTCWGPSATGGKSSSSKMAKQAVLAFVKRTLERCCEFEEMGKGCFSEPLFREMFLSGSSRPSGARSADVHTDGESGKSYASASSRSMEARVQAAMGSQPSPQTSQLSQNVENYTSDLFPSVNHLSEQTTAKEDTWSNKVKKRELLLDDVGGGTIGTSTAPSGIGSSLSSSTKGKRSERDREGKGHNREVSSRNGTNKFGRPALSNAKSERKCKTKPKQKTTQLSASVNGLLGKKSERTKPKLPSEAKPTEITVNSNVKEKYGFGLDVLDDREAIDLSTLLPGIDDDGQGHDIGSWLDIDDDGLHDHGDFMGLEIPMDDLSDLNMMAVLQLLRSVAIEHFLWDHRARYSWPPVFRFRLINLLQFSSLINLHSVLKWSEDLENYGPYYMFLSFLGVDGFNKYAWRAILWPWFRCLNRTLLSN